MTIAELIEMLSEYPADTVVKLFSADENKSIYVEAVNVTYHPADDLGDAEVIIEEE